MEENAGEFNEAFPL